MKKIVLFVSMLPLVGCITDADWKTFNEGIKTNELAKQEREIAGQQQSGEGFRGISWGADFNSVKSEMTLVDDGGEQKWYLRKNEKLAIGNAELVRIGYGFYKGHLFSVGIYFTGPGNYLSLKQVFTDKYGIGYQPNQFMERYNFDAGESISLVLKYSEVTAQGEAFYTNNVIADQMKDDEAAKNKAGAVNDL